MNRAEKIKLGVAGTILVVAGGAIALQLVGRGRPDPRAVDPTVMEADEAMREQMEREQQDFSGTTSSAPAPTRAPESR